MRIFPSFCGLGGAGGGEGMDCEGCWGGGYEGRRETSEGGCEGCGCEGRRVTSGGGWEGRRAGDWDCGGGNCGGRFWDVGEV